MSRPASSSGLLADPNVIAEYEALFCLLYEVDEPLLPLGEVLHWIDIARGLGFADARVNAEQTWVFGGYFYNTTTAAPTASDIGRALGEGQRRGVEQFLVPTVPRDAPTDALLAAGFVRLPWFVESRHQRDGDLDADLRAAVGPRRYRQIRRLWRRGNASYPPTFAALAELQDDPAALETVANLHGCNVRKYGHARNFYDLAVLTHLGRSPLGEHLLVCVRRDSTDGTPVQMSLSLADRDSESLYMLVQGIDRDRVATGHNLFIADTYEVYRWGADHGVRTFSLGRGVPADKARLGANEFVVLDNWLLVPPDRRTEVEAIAAAAEEATRWR